MCSNSRLSPGMSKPLLRPRSKIFCASSFMVVGCGLPRLNDSPLVRGSSRWAAMAEATSSIQVKQRTCSPSPTLDKIGEDVGYALFLLGFFQWGDYVERPPDGVVQPVLLLERPAQPLPYQLGEPVVRVRDPLLVHLFLVARDRLAAFVD